MACAKDSDLTEQVDSVDCSRILIQESRRIYLPYCGGSVLLYLFSKMCFTVVLVRHEICVS